MNDQPVIAPTGIGKAMADAYDLGRAEALDAAQERISAILFGLVDDETFERVMAALDAVLQGLSGGEGE